MRTLLLLVLVLLGLFTGTAPPSSALPLAAGPEGLAAGVLPVPGGLVTPFRPPPEPWLAGHRGVDLAAEPGDPVRAAAAGIVTYAGPIAGRGVVVVDHGALRTTYEPVSPGVSVGQRVEVGTMLGVLQAGHAACAPVSCLHWGLRRGEEYLDPLLLPVASPGGGVRLVAEAEVGAAEREAAARAVAEALARAAGVDAAFAGGSTGASSVGTWSAPVAGPVTSPFGMRVHPVTGVYKLHDGVDYGAACGSPIRAPLDGIVTEVAWHSAYGWRARVDHGTVDGRRLVTSFNHALSYSVRAGQAVSRGQVLGAVGSTGWSTGCHLHLMAWQDGRLVNPAQLG